MSNRSGFVVALALAMSVAAASVRAETPLDGQSYAPAPAAPAVVPAAAPTGTAVQDSAGAAVAVEDAGAPTPGSAGGALEVRAYGGPAGIAPGPRPGGRPLAVYRNRAVDSVIRYFLQRKRDVIERGYRRAGRYLPMVRRILREEGVPVVLAYLAVVESNFNPRARSTARAVGMWQFTAPTARIFGLRIYRPWYDERLDPESSTRAAARFLAYLYDRYGNWELALAAYNAGEGRVNRALRDARRRGAPQDFWSLRLPRETRGYVPAFLAIAAIMAAPVEHGLAHLEQEEPWPTEAIEVRIAATLADIAGRIDTPAERLVALNPAWKSGLIPPLTDRPVVLHLPVAAGPRLMASLRAEPPKPIPWRVHTVREGETVSEIASAYGVRTRDVLALNRLGWRSMIGIGRPLLVPVAADTPLLAAVDDDGGFKPAASAQPAVTQLHLHTVRSGESLWSIARHYGVRMTQLRLWNRLRDSVLQPNQELLIFLSATGG